jgi:hypothetical protein
LIPHFTFKIFVLVPYRGLRNGPRESLNQFRAQINASINFEFGKLLNAPKTLFPYFIHALSKTAIKIGATKMSLTIVLLIIYRL